MKQTMPITAITVDKKVVMRFMKHPPCFSGGHGPTAQNPRKSALRIADGKIDACQHAQRIVEHQKFDDLI
jgi:hypothetical protein